MWIDIHEELPVKGQAVWLYDAMFGNVDATTVMCDPSRIDGDYTHWMPRKSSTKPKPPIDGKVHATGFSKEE
jgi:hypothetical protein